MNIEQIIKNKHDLEDSIGQLIAVFESETKTKIEDISIERLHIEEYGELPKDILGKIKIRIVIP